MELSRVSAIVLAGGASRRFGKDDKLIAPLNSKPVAQHVADCLVAAQVANKYAIVRRDAPDVRAIFENLGFEALTNPNPEQGQGSSLALGAAEALKHNPAGLLICLADMPFVTPEILKGLAAGIGSADVAICSKGAAQISPPALFSGKASQTLASLTGDIGAKQIIGSFKKVVHLEIDPVRLRDIDVIEDLPVGEV